MNAVAAKSSTASKRSVRLRYTGCRLLDTFKGGLSGIGAPCGSIRTRRAKACATLAEGNEFGCQNRGVLRAGVAAGSQEAHIAEPGFEELIAESNRFLRASDSREPVAGVRAGVGVQRGCKEEFRAEHGAARLEDTREFRKDPVAERIQVKDTVNKSLVRRSRAQR